MLKRAALILFFAVFLSQTDAYANDVVISNQQIISNNSAQKTLTIGFDISWQNSWRDNSKNYDAVWVFMKYYSYGDEKWHHARLKRAGNTTSWAVINPPGFSKGSGTPLEIVMPADKTGCFLQRAAEQVDPAPVNTSGIRFVWDYSNGASGYAGGLSNQDDISTIRIQIHAIEMVFVPTGGFYVGDGDGATQSTGAFYKVDYTGTGNEIVNTPVFINYLEDAYLTWDNSVVPGKKIVKVSGGFGIEYMSGGSFLKNDKWPDGYGAFYCMKYEISQAQYRDFLNSITRVQQESRARIVDETVKKYAFYTVLDYTPAHRYVGKRNFIRTKISYIPDPTKPIRFGCDYAANRFEGDAVYDSADDGEWTAMNYLTESDFLAYADWAGLRPMTELEWEKACRGHGTPKTGEYAWGSTALNKGTMMASVLDAGTDEERFSGLNGVDGVSNYGQAFDDNGPMRCGFASRPGTTRAQAGASCWGALDMTGNLSEFVVSILEGTFEGTHGDGTLAVDGNSDNTDWSCGTFKDFSWMAFFFMPVSARSDGFLDDQAMGGRLVRTAHDAF